jgi:hypothetical protein
MCLGFDNRRQISNFQLDNVVFLRIFFITFLSKFEWETKGEKRLSLPSVLTLYMREKTFLQEIDLSAPLIFDWINFCPTSANSSTIPRTFPFYPLRHCHSYARNLVYRQTPFIKWFIYITHTSSLVQNPSSFFRCHRRQTAAGTTFERRTQVRQLWHWLWEGN